MTESPAAVTSSNAPAAPQESIAAKAAKWDAYFADPGKNPPWGARVRQFPGAPLHRQARKTREAERQAVFRRRPWVRRRVERAGLRPRGT